MAPRRFPLAVLIGLALGATAHAQEPPGVLLIGLGEVEAGATVTLPDGTVLVPPGTTATNQQIIPRYRAGSAYPSGQLVGWGVQSVLAATAQTAAQDEPAVVITQGIDEPISEWQAGSGPEYTAAVLQPRITDLSIHGHSSDWTTNNVVGDQPNITNLPVGSHPDLYDGLRAVGGGGVVREVNIFGVPGTALYVARVVSSRVGKILPYDRVRWDVSRINCRRVFRGTWIDALDSSCADIEVESFRDWGVRIGSTLRGSIHFQRIHVFGGGHGDDPDGTGGAAIWVDGSNCQGQQIYPENAQVGLHITGPHCLIQQLYSHSCGTANVRVWNDHCRINQFHIGDVHDVNTYVTGIGIHMAGQYTTVTDGVLELKNNGSTDPAAMARAITLQNGSNQCIRDVRINSHNQANTIGILATAITLTNSTIDGVFMKGGAKGLDLDAATIPLNGCNYIRFNSEDTADAYDLPANVTTTVNAADTNFILINGTRFYVQN